MASARSYLERTPVPTFSVIVPTLDRADLLSRALRSLRAQTFGDFEVIVVDDGSAEPIRSVVEGTADPRIRFIGQGHQGVSGARNTGISAARGRYVAFLDSDDEALPGWLQSLASEVISGPYAIVSCGATYLDRSGRIHRVALPVPVGTCGSTALFLAGTYAVRRDVFELTGGFNTELQFGENTELALRLVASCESRGWVVHSIDEPMVLIHATGSTVRDDEAVLAGVKYVLTHHRAALERDPDDLADYLSVVGVKAARLGRHREARGYLRAAIRARPGRLKSYARFVVSLSPSMAQRVWSRHQDRPTP